MLEDLFQGSSPSELPPWVPRWLSALPEYPEHSALAPTLCRGTVSFCVSFSSYSSVPWRANTVSRFSFYPLACRGKSQAFVNICQAEWWGEYSGGWQKQAASVALSLGTPKLCQMASVSSVGTTTQSHWSQIRSRLEADWSHSCSTTKWDLLVKSSGLKLYVLCHFPVYFGSINDLFWFKFWVNDWNNTFSQKYKNRNKNFTNFIGLL